MKTSTLPNTQKLIGALIIFIAAIAVIFPPPYNFDIDTIALALSGAATFYFGTQIVPLPLPVDKGA